MTDAPTAAPAAPPAAAPAMDIPVFGEIPPVEAPRGSKGFWYRSYMGSLPYTRFPIGAECARGAPPPII